MVKKALKKRVKKVKSKVRKARGKVKKEAKFQTKSLFFRFLYLTGLTAIIPAVVINAAPTELAILTGTPFSIMVAAIFLVVVGISGTLKLYGSDRDGCNALAWTTLFPGFLALGVSFGVDKIIRSLVTMFAFDLTRIQSLVELYIEKAIPHVWFLILGYVAIGGLWYLLGKATQR